MNELVIVLSIFIYFGGTIMFFKLFGKSGLYVWTAIMSIIANIEALILVDAFGMEMTLGNVAFASTFLVTDIISERYGKKASNKAVWIGISTSILFILTSLMITNVTGSANDFAMPGITLLFGFVPRIVIASLSVYFLVQFIDIKLYHAWWNFSTNKIYKGNKTKGLWIRNNGSTIVSQLLNAFLFTFIAYYGVFPNSVLITIFLTMYVVYVVTTTLDTPFAYFAKKLKIKE